jgi:hypothetical protein
MGKLKKMTAAAVVVIALAPGATSANAAVKYPNCTALTKVFKNGVAKNRAAIRGLEFRPAVKKRVYLANTHLDRDKDGVACERG